MDLRSVSPPAGTLAGRRTGRLAGRVGTYARLQFKEDPMVAVGGGVGKVVQIIGTVVDLEFPADQIPDLYNAVAIEVTGVAAKEHASVTTGCAPSP